MKIRFSFLGIKKIVISYRKKLLSLALLILVLLPFFLYFYPSALKIIAHQLTNFNISTIAETISSISLILLGITIPIFVLTVTLLGNAAQIAEEQKLTTERENNEGFNAEIAKLKSQSISLKDIDVLKNKIADLESKKLFTEEKIKRIEIKYASLGLKQSVIIPDFFFISSALANNWLYSLSKTELWGIYCILIGLIFLFIGLKKIIFTLSVVEEISIIADSRKTESLKSSLIEALKTVESEKTPNPTLIFNEKTPFLFKPDIETKIQFDVDLKLPGAMQANNVDIWFIFPPEIEILNDAKYSKPFKQGSSYKIPNANTVRYKFDSINKYTQASGVLKIKPTAIGKFKMQYKVNCDGHIESTSDHELDILVQE